MVQYLHFRILKFPLIIGSTTSGWWYTNPSEKFEFVSWDDEKNPN